MTRALKPTDYKAIMLWGKTLGSYASYIRREQSRACEQGAPLDAIYYDDHASQWKCISDLSPTHWIRQHYEHAQANSGNRDSDEESKRRGGAW